MKLALKESSQNVNMTNDLVTGGFQKITFQYETPCNTPQFLYFRPQITFCGWAYYIEFYAEFKNRRKKKVIYRSATD